MVTVQVFSIVNIVGAVMIAQERALPSISVYNSTVCIGTPVTVTTNSNNTVFDWRLYNTLPSSPLATFSTQNFTVTLGFTGTKFPRNFSPIGTFNISLSTYSPCCSWSIPQFSTVTINPLPSLSFNLSSSYCNNDVTSYNLNAIPSGGIFQGQGIVYTSYFSPSSVVPGTYSIDYSYTNPITLCSNNLTLSTTVYDVPSVSFLGLQDAYCKNEENVILAGNPSGGVFTGLGISGNIWNISSVNTSSLSSINLTYSYTFPSTGCVNTLVKTVTLNQVPSLPSINNLFIEYCQNEDTVNLQASPVGGIFTSDVVFPNGTFVPRMIVPGTYNVTYTVTNLFNCSNSITRYFTIKEVPSISFPGIANQYCVDAPEVNLIAENDNYTLTGPGKKFPRNFS